MLDHQFCWSRNATYPTPDPFWSRSPQCHPLWQNSDWVLTCNSYTPPGHVEVDSQIYGVITAGDDLRRWSLYPRSAPQLDFEGVPIDYLLWQSRNAGSAESLPADMYRAGEFPYPYLSLEGRSADNYNERLIVQPVNP